ncbi:toxin HicA [Ectothiorhodospira magna]|nr:toxin HicA [Ectothiorhodospira magna]
MASIEKILERLRREPANVRFADLRKVCMTYFGEPRQSGTSHLIFKTPWPGDPRVNIQDAGGKAKAYQVRQVLKAIDKLEDHR